MAKRYKIRIKKKGMMLKEDEILKFSIPKIYLETTVFNYYFLNDEGRKEEQEDTMKLFKEIEKRRFEAFISNVVIAEIIKCEEPKRSMMLNLVDDFSIPLVPNIEGCEELADIYVTEGIFPRKKRNDALHLAFATVNSLDTVVSWNCRHIVKYKVRRQIRVINIIKGYKEIDVNTPTEVLYE